MKIKIFEMKSMNSESEIYQNSENVTLDDIKMMNNNELKDKRFYKLVDENPIDEIDDYEIKIGSIFEVKITFYDINDRS